MSYMTANQFAYLFGVFVVSVVLGSWSFRKDRFLGLVVVTSLLLRLTGSVAIDSYLRQERGRDNLMGDEIAYLGAGEAILAEWEGGIYYEDRFQVSGMRGIYPFWNAMAIRFWGHRSLTPLRLANNLMATVAVILAFFLGRRLFPGRSAARIASVLVALSPSLFLWSLTNLREIFLGVGVLAVVLSFIAVVGHARFRNIILLLLSLIFLGSVRHYYAVLLGWMSVPGYLVLGQSSKLRRMFVAALLTIFVGFALYVVAGDLMALSVTGESLGRAVDVAGDSGGSVEGIRKIEKGVQYVGFIPNPLVVIRNLPFVMFGRFGSIQGGGRVISLLLLPEWLATFVIIPLALWAVYSAFRKGSYEVLFPAVFIGCMMIGLAWFHGDPWTTIRFRLTYWPLVLVLAAGGLSLVRRPKTAPSGRSHSIRSEAESLG